MCRRRIALKSANLPSLFDVNLDNFISRFVAVDETWLHHFDPERKAKSMTWKQDTSPPPRKFRVVMSARKVIATVFWESEGIVLIDYLEHGSTISGNDYADWLENVERQWKRRDAHALRCAVLLGQCAMRLLTHYHKHRVPSEMSVSNAPSPTVFARPDPR